MNASRSAAERLSRVVELRETLAAVAETRLREAENRILDIQAEQRRVNGQIEDARAIFAQPQGCRGQAIQQNEKYISALKRQRQTILQALENAKKIAELRRQEWIEARREQRIIERLQERRLQQWQRHEEIASQKAADDAFIGKLVRSRSQK